MMGVRATLAGVTGSQGGSLRLYWGNCHALYQKSRYKCISYTLTPDVLLSPVF